jgi:hypothetical protein
MPRANIELELYDENNESVKKLARVVVPWGILKKAVRLARVLDKASDQLDESEIDQIADLVVQIFGESNVTRKELDQYADVGDMMTVLMGIINRARGIVPNAPPAA